MLDNIDFKAVELLLRQVGRMVLSRQGDAEWRVLIDEENFKTTADLNAHNLLLSGLKQINPTISVFSEEHKHTCQDRPDMYWLIDPIDGTASWYHGFRGFVSQLALIKQNKPVFGAIYWPAEDIIWSACESKGAFRNGEILRSPRHHDGVILVDNYPEPRGLSKQIYDALTPTQYMECGSIGLKCALVADGTADIFAKNTLFRDWDIAPALVILREVNASMTDLSLNPFKIGTDIEMLGGLLVCRDAILAQRVVNQAGVHAELNEMPKI